MNAEQAAPTVALDETFRDDLARALRTARHAEIADEVEATVGDSNCGGPERCGGCGMCVYMQATWTDHTDEGWAADRARADKVLASLRGQAEFRARQVTS